VSKLIIRDYKPSVQVAILIDACGLLSRMRAIDPRSQERNNSLAWHPQHLREFIHARQYRGAL